MSGYFRMEADVWESIRDLLPRPLSREHAAMDLRHEADKCRLHEGGRLPDHEELAIRWGWVSSSGRPADKRVRLLKADEIAWKDPYRMAQKGQAKGSGGAGEGQAKGRRRAAPERTEADNQIGKGSGGAGEGQAKGSGGAGEGPHARSRPPAPTPVTGTEETPLPPGGGLTGSDPQPVLVEPEPDPLTEAVPSWAKGWAAEARVPLTEFYADLAAVVDDVRGHGRPPSKGDSAEVMGLYRSLGPRPPWRSFVADLRLVAVAAKDCPDALFANDIRGKQPDGRPKPGMTDRSASMATLCRRQRWEDRVDGAKAWEAAGKPTARGSPEASRVSPSGASWMDDLRALREPDKPPRKRIDPDHPEEPPWPT